MQPKFENNWQPTIKEAYEIQNQLAKKVIKENTFGKINRIAGVDVAYDKICDRLITAIAVLDTKTLTITETTFTVDKVSFPYIPGLFSFRELPPLIKAFRQLKEPVDLVICDGQGYAHPRRFGLACHLGVLYDIPTIGCGKTKLIGDNQMPLLDQRGAFTNLIDNQEIIGVALRTQNNVRPVFISIGHKINLDTACEWILKLTPKFRLPEVIRKADQLVNQLLKKD